MAMPNFVAIETFYWVARLGGFHATAKRLHVTQPTVSYRIRELEESLGVQVFERKERGVVLTAEGAALLHYAEKIVAIAREIESKLKVRSPVCLSLRLGVIGSFSHYCLPFLLNNVEKEFPAIRLTVIVDHSPALSRKLSAGELDVALLTQKPNPEEVESIHLGQQEFVWVTKKGTERENEEEPGEGGGRRRVFSTPAPSTLYGLIQKNLEADRQEEFHFGICNDISAILGFVRTGLGIGLLPRCMVERDLKEGVLKKVPSFASPLSLPVYIGQTKGVINRSLSRIVPLIAETADQYGFCKLKKADPCPFFPD